MFYRLIQFTGVPNLSSTDSSPVLRKSDFHAPIRETNSSPPNYSEKSATEDSDYGKHKEKDVFLRNIAIG